MDQAPTVRQKSRQFAVRIVRLYQHLGNEKREFILSKQLLRSGTSIGANVAESECAFSRKDFLAKMYIAFKECNETLYWLDFCMKRTFCPIKSIYPLSPTVENCIKSLLPSPKPFVKQNNT